MSSLQRAVNEYHLPLIKRFTVTLDFFMSNLEFCLELGLLSSET